MKNLMALLVISGLVVIVASFTLNDNNPIELTDDYLIDGTEDYSFDEEGNLIRPEGYRKWIYVGTPVTPNELNNGAAPFPEFHNVYIHPEDFEHWENTGKFKDGTIMVKELVSVGSKNAVSGNGYFMGDFVGLEATIKDSKRFPDEPGNWAYFSFGHSFPYAAKAKAFPTNACNACHAASAADDFVFTQYYPILTASKGGNSQAKNGSNAVPNPEHLNTDAMRAVLNERTTDRSSPPAEKKMLMNWLNMDYYKEWYGESAVHPSIGPHTDVKVYYNPILEESMKAGNKNHPIGAASVKEQYKDGVHYGWSVAVKIQEESEYGNGWYWMESFDKTDLEQIPFEGVGFGLCAGCHVRPGNQDLILSGYPLN